MGKLVGSEDTMKAVCWLVIEGEAINITKLTDPLYYIAIVFVGTKSMFVETVYNQKLSDSSHVCRGLSLVKKTPVLPRGKTAWGVVKRVRVVKTREDVVKTKLGVVFCLWGRRYSLSAFQRQHPRADARRLRPTRPY